jgi:hypothetical protein
MGDQRSVLAEGPQMLGALQPKLPGVSLKSALRSRPYLGGPT